MTRINLLPWREEKRKEDQQQFFITLAMFVVIVLAIWGMVHLLNITRIEYQQTRIQFLKTHVDNLEQKIEKIKLLEKEKEKLKARIQAIEQLQGNRPLVVRLFDELVDNLPEGVSIINMKQSGTEITISGVAESNARVSSFMRNLDASEWLQKAQLNVIEAKDEDNQRVSNFTINFQQRIPSAEEEA